LIIIPHFFALKNQPPSPFFKTTAIECLGFISFSLFCIRSAAVGCHPQDLKIAYQVHSDEGSIAETPPPPAAEYPTT
jgi:hypothetical protein